MLDEKKLQEVGEKLLNIVQDLSWVEFHNKKTGHEFSVMSVKSLILQVKDVEKIFEELIEE